MGRFNGYWVAVKERRWWRSRGEVGEDRGGSHARHPCFSLMQSQRYLPFPRDREHRRHRIALLCRLSKLPIQTMWELSSHQCFLKRDVQIYRTIYAGSRAQRDWKTQQSQSEAPWPLWVREVYGWGSSRCSQAAPQKQAGFSQMWAGLLEASEGNDQVMKIWKNYLQTLKIVVWCLNIFWVRT